MERNRKSSFYFGTLLLLVAVFAVSSFKISNAYAIVDEYVIEASEENGSFEIPREYFNWAQLDFPRDKYPGKIEVYFDGEKLSEIKGYPDGVSFQMGDYFPESYRTNNVITSFTNTVSVRILQDGEEFYSAKWKIYDNDKRKFAEEMVGVIVVLFLFTSTFLALVWFVLSNLIAALEKWRIKAWMFILLLILDIIAIIIYFSSQSML